jgi:Na+-transporting NADH:ubiquinone oxidoreductase subunit NqrC
MSEKESKFILWLSVIGGSLVTAIIIGAFVFYIATEKAASAQEEKNKYIEMRMQVQEKKVETMRIEWREDIKEIKMNIDKVAESQERKANQYEYITRR